LYEELPLDDLEAGGRSKPGHRRDISLQSDTSGVVTATAATQTGPDVNEAQDDESYLASALRSLISFGGSRPSGERISDSSDTLYEEESVFETHCSTPAADQDRRSSGEDYGRFSVQAGGEQQKQPGIHCLDVVATGSRGSSPAAQGQRRTESRVSEEGSDSADIDRILAAAVLSAPAPTLGQKSQLQKAHSLHIIQSGVSGKSQSDMKRSSSTVSLLSGQQYGSPMWYQIYILMLRFFRSWMRTPIMILAEAAQYVILGVFTGLLYLNTPNVLPDAPYDKMSSVFLTLCLLAFTPSYTALIVWDYERQLLRRESATGTYRRWVR
jgi:hypothetical protein